MLEEEEEQLISCSNFSRMAVESNRGAPGGGGDSNERTVWVVVPLPATSILGCYILIAAKIKAALNRDIFLRETDHHSRYNSAVGVGMHQAPRRAVGTM